MVLDAGKSLVLAANSHAAELLTGRAGDLKAPLQLDAATPAIALIRGLDACGALAHGLQQMDLTFWGKAGAMRLAAAIQLLPDGGPGVVLVSPLPTLAADRRTLPGQSLPGRELRLLAHELRTPLAAILSLADIMHGGHLGSIENARHKEYLASMRETARHALKVIEAMLAQPSGSTNAVVSIGNADLNAAVSEVAAAMGALATRTGARLIAAPAVGLPTVAANGTALRQMLVNVVANGIAHGGEGVTLQLTTGVDRGGGVWVEVSDNGPGIPQSVLDRIDVGAAFDGKGRPQLGLSITRSLALANGGRLEIASAGEGARVRLVFQPYQTGGTQAVASSRG